MCHSKEKNVMKLYRSFVSIYILFSLYGCGDGSWKVVEVSSPAAVESGEPFLASLDNEIWMSWLQKTSTGHSLKYSRWNGEWSTSQTIASGVPFFVNWADFPSVLPLSENRMVTHWLEKKGEGAYAYFVMTSLSDDRGRTWSRPVAAHTDTSENEHGFASLVDDGAGNYSITWLDGRKFTSGHDSKGEMALMYSKVVPDQFRNEVTLDPRVCDCCQTAAVRTANGVFIAYRDRSENEIRDISYVRLVGDQWTPPKNIYKDGWHIEGCPVNGPAVDAVGDDVVVAWYTGAGQQGRVRVAFSKNNGESFGSPVQVDDGNPSGRVDVVFLEDGSAVVIWLENRKDQGAEIQLKQIFPDGQTGKTLTIADTSQARSSGFPRIARAGKELLIAWTYADEPPKIRVAKIVR
jgi:hypothetical protein